MEESNSDLLQGVLTRVFEYLHREGEAEGTYHLLKYINRMLRR